MSEKKKYKDTLNLPKTDFDMRAGLLKKEPAMQAKWQSGDVYGRIRGARADAGRFILHDGPPYANGNIHMGTALNKILKDMVVRIKTMSGLDCRYLPGWDCHGLPIEAKVVDELGEQAASLCAGEIRKRCVDYAERFIDLQREQFRRLGVMGEFDEPYVTMNPGYESAVLEVFAQLVEKGLVYKQLKPVHWSIANRTALADAELEYHDREDTSIYVPLELTEASLASLPGVSRPVSLLVWTTTPWTLPANRAVAAHPNVKYLCVSLRTADGEVTWLLAEKRLEAVLGAADRARPGWVEGHEVRSEVWGNDLVAAGMEYVHPLLVGRTCPLVGADYVTTEDGTGLVHTAPGHGLEDYGTGLKHGLEIACPVGPDGVFDDSVPQWLEGMGVWDANMAIVEHLAGRMPVITETISHSYPHDWRSKTPTIFRATEQWFVAVDKPLPDGGASLRERAMEVCNRPSAEGGVDFLPGWGQNRMQGMLENRPDWCLSRQRAWGLPIPAFYNAQDRPLLTPASVRAVAKVVSEQGSDAWFALSPSELLAQAGYDPLTDPDLDNPHEFAPNTLRAGRDIFDVWFESGSSWRAVVLRRGLADAIPIDMYLEGSDQHRGWFQLSLLPALGCEGVAPFRTLLTHGFVVDEEGRKMSKSVGNVVSVLDQLQQRGADILRLWVASQNYQDDVRCSDALIAQSEDAYRKIRNTLRFCMAACGDFDPAEHAADPPDHSVDLWMRMELMRLTRDVRGAYDRYEFHRATRLLYEFCTIQASSIYFSAVKDRLYCETPGAIRRRATQTVLHEVLVTLVKLLAPVLCHTAEEAWEHIPARDVGEPDSVHLALLPEVDEETLRLAEDLRPVDRDASYFEAETLTGGPAEVWSRLLGLRSEGLSLLEDLRNRGVKNPLDVEAVFQVAHGDDAAEEFIRTYLKELEDLLGVGYARVETVESDALEPGQAVRIAVHDTRETYARCARSWKRRPDVGSDADYPDLSARDAVVMKEIERG